MAGPNASENEWLELERLVEIYVRTKELILDAEGIDEEARATITVFKEQRDALDHLMRFFAEAFNDKGRENSTEYKRNTTRIRLMSTPESGQDLRGYAASKRRAAPSFGETVLVVV